MRLCAKQIHILNQQRPKFKIQNWHGQQVCVEWECDDDLDPTNFGKTLRDYGVIVGMVYQQPEYGDGWA
ncbi:hypothetical protein [Cylindrospermum sp. FACHB-282]|uniref:hypothetical protein n=1 Tax=Cylindrospermum sp. FACHB-282 TaxID=2692794 RepID=UPI001687766D|nr:hypothetical protein [Cylindrospermum sp. FACHB-282]MBD2384972.1 hypothetical protein [Cylindrospermum sp. FACHB-282]